MDQEWPLRTEKGHDWYVFRRESVQSTQRDWTELTLRVPRRLGRSEGHSGLRSAIEGVVKRGVKRSQVAYWRPLIPHPSRFGPLDLTPWSDRSSGAPDNLRAAARVVRLRVGATLNEQPPGRAQAGAPMADLRLTLFHAVVRIQWCRRAYRAHLRGGFADCIGETKDHKCRTSGCGEFRRWRGKAPSWCSPRAAM